MHVAIATCAEVPNLDEDGPLVLSSLRERGIDAEPAVWDDPNVPWKDFDRVILRSTWDYPSKWRDFVSWLEKTSRCTGLVNPLHVVRWNLDKRYLRLLSEHGIPTVPTHWIEGPEALSIPDDAWDGGNEVVVKPAISAGSKDTMRFGRDEGPTIDQLVADIVASGRPVMVQPYMHSVDERGETALLYFRGQYSHAIRKGPLLALGDDLESGLFRKETIAPRVASPEERTLGERVLDALPFHPTELTYARIDVVVGNDGRFRVIEVELIEPSLFLHHDGDAAGRLAHAISLSK